MEREQREKVKFDGQVLRRVPLPLKTEHTSFCEAAARCNGVSKPWSFALTLAPATERKFYILPFEFLVELQLCFDPACNLVEICKNKQKKKSKNKTQTYKYVIAFLFTSPEAISRSIV